MPNKSSPHGGFISEGTVSHATLRTEDLLLRFADEIDRVFPFNGRELSYEARNVQDYDSDEAIELVNEMIDQLDRIAQREGFYFGAHPGDGSDFGYWKSEDEYEDGDAPRDSAGNRLDGFDDPFA